MRWKEKPEPQWHDDRIKEHFLFLPKKIRNEWRWLEKAKYKQNYEYINEKLYYDSHITPSENCYIVIGR